MKKLFTISFVLFALSGVKSASAQNFYYGGPSDGTYFHYHDDGTTGGLNAEIDFANFETIYPNTTPPSTYAVVTYAAIEIWGVDINNDQVTIAAIGTPLFDPSWIGHSSLYVSGLSSNDPSIVSPITAILTADYSDPLGFGDYTVYAENDGYTAPVSFDYQM
jgi:hypothetical protein